MAMVRTQAGYVEAWECDSNAHLNVQFYWKRFEAAAAALHAMAGRAPGRLRVRHVRYHREQRLDETSAIDSGVVTEGPAAGQLLHRMTMPDGRLSATALDLYDAADGLPGAAALADQPGAAAALDDLPGRAAPEDLPDALPRGIPAGAAEAIDARGLLAAGRAVVSEVSVADPMRFDAGGAFLPHQFTALFSNGAAHVWQSVGVTADWLAERRLGRVAVEQQMTLLEPVRPGAVLRQISWVSAAAGRTVRLAHQIEDLGSGAAVARGEVTALLLDLQARRTVALPEDLAARAAAFGP